MPNANPTIRRRRLIAVCSVLMLAGKARAQAADPRLAANPALGDLARTEPDAARAILADIDRRLAGPPPPGPRLGGVPDDATRETLDSNPLLSQLYARDPAAALDMLARIKAAGKVK